MTRLPQLRDIVAITPYDHPQDKLSSKHEQEGMLLPAYTNLRSRNIAAMSSTNHKSGAKVVAEVKYMKLPMLPTTQRKKAQTTLHTLPR